jgi:uncharacterized protein
MASPPNRCRPGPGVLLHRRGRFVGSTVFRRWDRFAGPWLARESRAGCTPECRAAPSVSAVHLYSGTTTDFGYEAITGVIVEKLKASFFDYYRYQPPNSEVMAWRNSLRAMASVAELAGLTDHGVLVEYQLPLSSKRLDVMFTGHSGAGRPMATVVELKQWDDAMPTDIPELVLAWVGGGQREVLHPSVQVGQYRRYLLDTHESFSEGQIGLRASAYLHNFMHDDQSELFASRHAAALNSDPLFAGDQVDELSLWLQDHLSGGGGVKLLDSVLEGRFRPHKKLLAHTAKMIKGEPSYVLLDEQKVSFNSVLAGVAEAHRTDDKTVYLINGGPGTGKSVVALNLVAELSEAGYSTLHATGSRAFTGNVRKVVGGRASSQFKYFNSFLDAEQDSIDVLICDEAHRIREFSHSRFTPKDKRTDDPQVNELINVARVAVFFIDDLQVVRPGEIGSSDLIRQAAAQAGVTLKEYELEAQFRCGGSESFVSWVENTLVMRRTADVIWDGADEFDFDVVDSVEELQAIIRAKDSEGHSARLAAGFCWPWSKPNDDGTLVDDVVIGEFAMPWNARPNAGRLASGIPKSDYWATDDGGIDQVGCVYTAQGFEFDYVGVIFGRDLVYRFGEGWVGQPEFSHDSVVRRALNSDDYDFTDLVKQTYRVLLTRGLKGCYVFFEDEETRDFVLSRTERAPGSRKAMEHS